MLAMVLPGQLPNKYHQNLYILNYIPIFKLVLVIGLNIYGQTFLYWWVGDKFLQPTAAPPKYNHYDD